MKPIPLLLALTLVSTGALAEDNKVSLSLSNHRFTPEEIHVKANTPSTVTLTNQDDQVEEFDSSMLRIEKIVAAHSTGTMRWRPLAPGRYKFMGEFHSETAQGIVVAE
ncbi:MAG: cupredoxin domain-containing protein [Alphaproteobacteria bacterium]|nr:cupredoxin domain-containing protein [Alphaproteobacteria bacterium]